MFPIAGRGQLYYNTIKSFSILQEAFCAKIFAMALIT